MVRRQNKTSSDLLTLAEAAAHLDLSVRTLRRYKANGRLKVVRVGRRLYCTLQDARNATTDGLSSVAASHMVDDGWSDRTVREWLQMVRGFMGSIVSSTRPLDGKLRYLEEITTRFGDLKVSQYLLRHLEEVHRIAKAEGWWLEDAEMLLVLPKEMPVIDALREVQARFAGVVPSPRDAGRRSARATDRSSGPSEPRKSRRPGSTATRRDPDRWTAE